MIFSNFDKEIEIKWKKKNKFQWNRWKIFCQMLIQSACYSKWISAWNLKKNYLKCLARIKRNYIIILYGVLSFNPLERNKINEKSDKSASCSSSSSSLYSVSLVDQNGEESFDWYLTIQIYLSDRNNCLLCLCLL